MGRGAGGRGTAGRAVGGPTVNPPESDLRWFLSEPEENEISIYHVTDADNVRDIAERGLVPGGSPALGQDWEAEHSKYATYFWGSRGKPGEEVERYRDTVGEGPLNLAIIKVGLPRNRGMARRVLPDEDLMVGMNQGLAALRHGESVALVGGASPNIIRSIYFTEYPGDRTVDYLMDRGIIAGMAEDL